MTAPSFLNWVNAAAAGTTAAITGTFANNGGPGDTISDSAGTAALVVDGHTVVLGDRVLVQNQASTYQNGMYVASTANTTFGQVGTITIGNAGSGYTNGFYRSLATTTNGGGTGLLVDVTVVGGAVTAVSVSDVYGDAPGQGGLAAGSGYAAGNTVILGAGAIGSGSNLALTVGTLAPAWVLTRSSDANSGYALNGLAAFCTNGTTNAGKAFVQNNGAVTLSVTSQISAAGTVVQPTASSNFPVVAGTYTNVPLAGGHGTGAGATVVVGTNSIATLGAITAGTGYTGTGTYNHVPLTGGTGTGATATITVSGGGVTAVTIEQPGTGYAATDSLSATAASIGGAGSGFAVAVSTVNAAAKVGTATVTTVGSGYQNGDVLSFGVYSGSGVSTGGVYGLGSGGTVAVTTSTPASSAVTFVAMSAL